MAKSIVSVAQIAKLLHAKGLIPEPNNVARIVIDLKAGDLPHVYVDGYGTDALLEVVGLLPDDPAAVDVRIT